LGTFINILKQVHRWSSIALIPVLLIAFAIIYSDNPRYYRRLTLEDNLVEWVTFTLLFLTSLLCIIIAAGIRRNKGPYFAFFLTFSIACILFSLEEISWGQRVFDIESPQFFQNNYGQKEINIHNVIQTWGRNIQVFSIPYHLKTKHIAGVTLFIYGTLLPIVSLNRTMRIFFRNVQIVIPPLNLSFSFLIGSLLMLDKPTGQEEEIGELFLSICLFQFAATEYLKRGSFSDAQSKEITK
jgi:hypothetical protein